MLPSVEERPEVDVRFDLLILLPDDDDSSVQLSLFDATGVGYVDDEFRGCYFIG